MMSAKLSMGGGVCLVLSILPLFWRFPMDRAGSGTPADVGVGRGSHTSTVGVRSRACSKLLGSKAEKALPKPLESASAP